MRLLFCRSNFYVSLSGNAGFLYAKRRFSDRETYVSASRNIDIFSQFIILLAFEALFINGFVDEVRTCKRAANGIRSPGKGLYL